MYTDPACELFPASNFDPLQVWVCAPSFRRLRSDLQEGRKLCKSFEHGPRLVVFKIDTVHSLH